MTANPNQHWGGKNHTSVSRFVTRIVGLSNNSGNVIAKWTGRARNSRRCFMVEVLGLIK